ncbi:Helix-turn-helix domain [uncultured Clostridium sp.]|uniref:helix-turn-helix transcriptional regulator n=1 Tax=uncultured Clostridium sp. TaxID=59620 RepID=UPI000822AE4A|nr:helix-turn-helix domain-containing protein [uncultured Clostridium sp.]SCI99080.1 Helix-turn-helix domain [uncultured Clostridium sp.]
MVKNRLLEIRLNLGYKKQQDFAEFLGINRNTYSLIENNKKSVNLDNAFLIAGKLKMKIEDIWYKE